MANRKKNRLKKDFSLGGEQAETDQLLQHAFFASGEYDTTASRTDARCFVIGRTGSGKSALFRHLQEVNPGHTIRINPENLSLPYIAELGAIRFLDSLNVHLDPLFIALWKHVLLVEIIRHRYSINTSVAKQNILETLRDHLKRDSSKLEALKYLDEFEGKFWCETDERVREITNKFEKQVDREAGGQLMFPHVGELSANAKSSSSQSSEVRSEQAERFQRLVNENQLGRLNKMTAVLDEDILDSDQHFTYIVIDDLDRDWVDERILNDLIRCLFRAVLDLKSVTNLKILVALRTNIFEQLDFGGRSGSQEEKYRSLVLSMRWTRRDLIEMLDERVEFATEGWENPLNSIKDLLPTENNTRGSALEYVLDRTLLRPRDAIAYINECIALAAGKSKLTWDEVKTAERAYSHKRLLALRDEWKGSYPDIDKLLEQFRGVNIPLDRSAIADRLGEAMLLPADPGFRGVRWMTEMSQAVWSGAGNSDWVDEYQPLIELLFNIGFLGIGSEQSSDFTYAFDTPSFARVRSNLGEDSMYLVHPTFQSALDLIVSRNRSL